MFTNNIISLFIYSSIHKDIKTGHSWANVYTPATCTSQTGNITIRGSLDSKLDRRAISKRKAKSRCCENNSGFSVRYSSYFLKYHCLKFHEHYHGSRYLPVSVIDIKCFVSSFSDFNGTSVSRFKSTKHLWVLCTHYDSHYSPGKFRKINCTEMILHSDIKHIHSKQYIKPLTMSTLLDYEKHKRNSSKSQ